MEELPIKLEPLVYDENRVNRFFARAIHATNYPRAYRPNRRTVDTNAFSDAVIGFFIDQSAATNGESSALHAANLGRVVCAINFLQGESMESLKESIEYDKLADSKGVLEFALGVAGEGARAARNLTFNEEPSRKEKIITTIRPPVDEYVDLEYFIRSLAERGVSRGKASAMMLLFRQQQSSALIEMQREAIRNMCLDLRPRLKKAMIYQPHKGDELVDQTFADGAMYIKYVLDMPFSPTSLDSIVEMRAKTNNEDPDEREQNKNYVLGHIGYVLNQLYP